MNTSVIDAAGNTTTFTYDGVNKTQRTDALGRLTNYTYDACNRLATINYPARPADNRTYAYDLSGNMLSALVAGYAHSADVLYGDGLAKLAGESHK